MLETLHIHPSKLKGRLSIPPSKSQTLRALLFSALAQGTSIVENPLPSPDTLAMVDAIEQLGANVHFMENQYIIRGTAGKPLSPTRPIDCGNSGLVLRFMGALAGLLPRETTLTGDHSIQTRRPVKPLLDALTQLGARALSIHSNDHAPILVQGPFKGKWAKIETADSQPVSGLLIASSWAPHPIELEVLRPGETPWIELTLDWLRRLQIRFEQEGFTRYWIEGNSQIGSFHYRVPGDWSSAAFPIAAALLTDSELTLENVDWSDPQGDKVLVSHLQAMGAKFTIDLNGRTLTVHKGASLRGIEIDLDGCIDALPILAVIGSLAAGRTLLYNGKIARYKESDRIYAIAKELKKMGVQVKELEEGLIIEQSVLKGSQELDSHQDHRVAMSLAVAALGAEGSSTLHHCGCIAKTYPDFDRVLQQLGARIEHPSLRI